MQTGFCAAARDLLSRMRDYERALVLFPAATFKRAAQIARASLIAKIFHDMQTGFCAVARDLLFRMRDYERALVALSSGDF